MAGTPGERSQVPILALAALVVGADPLGFASLKGRKIGLSAPQVLVSYRV
jgi:hypothetical protein